MENLLASKQYYYPGLDVLKILLAIIVVLRHCGQSFFIHGSIYKIVVTNIISPVAVPTFFIISSFLFFNKHVEGNNLKKYLLRLLLLYGVWTLVYLPLIIIDLPKTFNGGIQFLQRVVFDGSYFHLWYLPSLMFAILLTYILSKWMCNKALLTLSLLLFVLGTFVETYNFISPLLNWELYKTIFITTRNGLFFGFVFVVLGKIISEKVLFQKVRYDVLIIISVCLVAAEGVFLSVLKEKNLINMNFSSLFLSIFLVLIFKELNVKANKTTLRTIRNMSTIIFCLHPWIMRIFAYINHRLGLNGISLTIIVLVSTILSAWIIEELSNRVALLRKLY